MLMLMLMWDCVDLIQIHNKVYRKEMLDLRSVIFVINHHVTQEDC